MNVLFLGGPRDGERDEWKHPTSGMKVIHSHGKNSVIFGPAAEIIETVYVLQKFNTGLGYELNVAVATTVVDVLGDLIKGYKTTGPISESNRRLINQVARREWYQIGTTFDDLINGVITDARNCI